MFEGRFGGGRDESARLARIERKLDLVLRHLGLAEAKAAIDAHRAAPRSR
jgi:hypothetical protein